MNTIILRKHLSVVFTLLAMLVFLPAIATSHCDALNGPVVMAAKKALETGNVNLALIWVQKDDEAGVKEAFAKATSLRKANPEAQDVADTYFFETVVRVHRAGEGAPYTGLKPAGTGMTPCIMDADESIGTRSPEKVVNHLTKSVKSNLETKFAELMELSNYKADDVEAGRKYVAAYTQFMHFVEAIHQAEVALERGHTEAEKENKENHEQH